jgi:hypothetical protein
LQRWWRKRTSEREREREREREFEGRKEELEDHDKRENTLKVGRKFLTGIVSLSLFEAAIL